MDSHKTYKMEQFFEMESHRKMSCRTKILKILSIFPILKIKHISVQKLIKLYISPKRQSYKNCKENKMFLL
jgi:hypothetical protein